MIWTAIFLALIAGAAIPLGGFLANIEHFRSQWLETEFRHTVLAFGAGALVSAVALVLVPEGASVVSPWVAMVSFGGGAVGFAAVSRALARKGGSYAMVLAMVLDFIPEAMAMGAKFAYDSAFAVLLALMIALQNLPEGFNAFREIRQSTRWSAGRILMIFVGLALLGPVAAYLGFVGLSDAPQALGIVMLFASGGIMFLMFSDIAPKVPIDHDWAPPLGAVAGFMFGLLGYMLLV